MQNMVAAENGGWVGHMGEVAPSRAFFKFFLVPSMRPQLTLRSVDFRSVHRKRVLVVGVFLWGRFAQGVKSSPFCPQKPFLNGPNKAVILHGSE